ncbi:unnamed protein product [Aphis gossypii]|uniref:Uncharacterized protein n=1 Tax=Aphis gossypii TaxID=80765 RepID=A0A9P0J0E9_APHGO|nr:unnamed protein product [Aphis gossypii]
MRRRRRRRSTTTTATTTKMGRRRANGAGRLTARTWSSSPDSDHILPGPLITGEVALFVRRRSARAQSSSSSSSSLRRRRRRRRRRDGRAGAPRALQKQQHRGNRRWRRPVVVCFICVQVRRSTFVFDRRQPHA